MTEKTIEATLERKVKSLGGWAIKLLPFRVAGLPDRLVLMPLGRVFFVEMKSKGAKTEKIQEYVHKKLAKMGFVVYVIDDKTKLDNFLKEVI